MRSRSLRPWIIGLAALGCGVVSADVLRALLYPHPPPLAVVDTRPIEKRAADDKIAEIRARTHGEPDQMTIQEWKMTREYRRTGRIRGLPAVPGSHIIPGELTAGDLAIDEKMRGIFRRCKGDYKLLTPAEAAFIKSYVFEGYPLPRR